MALTASGKSLQKLRKNFDVSLVGYVSNQIVGAKLPSNRQVLSVLFYNLRIVNLKVKESALLVIQEVSIFWQKARIPTRRIDKLLKLYEEWKGLQKNLTRNAGKQKEKRDHFVEIMEDLFDISHSDAFAHMKNDEDKNFLMLQRQKGRPGSMADIDYKSEYKERALKRAAMETSRKKRTYDEMKEHLVATTEANDSTSSNPISDNGKDTDNSFEIVQQNPATPKTTITATVPET